jgi:pyrroline-5-carboxylate reductase
MEKTLFKDKRIALIGAGQMGGALLRGLLRSEKMSPGDIVVSEPRQQRATELEREYKVCVAQSNLAAVVDCDIVILAVKPQQIEKVLTEIKEGLDTDKTLISIAAGITTDYILEKIGKAIPIIRAMPNAPALIGKGMVVVSQGKHAGDYSRQIAEELLSLVGEVLVLEEKYQNQSTAINGSGPAYVFLFAEALIDAGVKVGLPRDVAF